PFPFDPIRFLALLNRYDRIRFVVILGFARLVRNITLVTIGALLAQYKLLFWAVFGIFMLLPLFAEWLMRRLLSAVRVEEAFSPKPPGVPETPDPEPARSR